MNKCMWCSNFCFRGTFCSEECRASFIFENIEEKFEFNEKFFNIDEEGYATEFFSVDHLGTLFLEEHGLSPKGETIVEWYGSDGSLIGTVEDTEEAELVDAGTSSGPVMDRLAFEQNQRARCGTLREAA